MFKIARPEFFSSVLTSENIIWHQLEKDATLQ
jgi:hypothetical protein